MPDNLSPENRIKTMRAVRGKNTGLERRLFAMVAGMRLAGWKRNAEDIAGKPDVVFPAQRVLIFADGCFWHSCPVCQRKLPETNREYWQQKITRNTDRDRRNDAHLRALGWTVVRVWEHEFRTSEGRAGLRKRIRAALQEVPVVRSEFRDDQTNGSPAASGVA